MKPSEEQETAIYAVANRLIISAGAGAGKTATLVARTRHLMIDIGVNASEIVAITFTVAAGNEFATRLGTKIAHAGTFHALLLKESRLWGVWQDNPEIIDEIRETDIINAEISRMKLSGVSATEVKLVLASGQPFQLFGKAGLAAKATRAKLLKANQLTMNLLMYEAVHHFVGSFNGRYKALIWDEFQDSGSAEMEIILKLIEADERLDVTIAGDNMQCIYGFRGSCPQNLQLLRTSALPSFETLSLTTNYRSTLPIIRYANSIPTRMSASPALAVRTAAVGALRMVPENGMRPTGVEPSLEVFHDDNEEVAFLKRLLDLKRKGETVGILCRSNAMRKRLAEALATYVTLTESHPLEQLREAFRLVETNKWQTGSAMAYVSHFWHGNREDTLIALNAAITESEAAHRADCDVFIGTIHAAKGLEFDTVVGVGMEAHQTPGTAKGLDLAEEWRLHYVLSTRAKKRLIFTRCESRRDFYNPAKVILTETSPLLSSSLH